MEKIPFFKHQLNKSYLEDIGHVLSSGFITSGDVGKSVEKKLRSFFSVEHTFLTNSWTNGALACLLAMDIKAGDEVILPAMTFIATANVVELLGAKPVFVDVNPKTLLLDLDLIRGAITPRTKCIIPVHLYGQMCDVRSIREMLDDYPQIYILEDAAHCFEGSRDGYKPGAYGDCAIFSFYATKNITCGEGGAVVTNNSELAERIVKTRLHGMSVGAIDRYKTGSYVHWDMDMLGVKANMPDLLAAFLPRQIDSIYEVLDVRTKIAKSYREYLAPIAQIKYQEFDIGVISAEHLLPIWVEEAYRDNLIAHLNMANIDVAVHYRSVPLRKYYKNKYGYTKDDFPISSCWGEGTLSLPLYPGLEEQSIAHIAKEVTLFFERQ